MEPTASARRDVDISALANLVDFIVDGGFLRHAHKELVLVFTRENRLVNRVFSVRDAFDFDNGLLTNAVNNAR